MLRDVEMMNLITEEGPLDLCFAPAGFPTAMTASQSTLRSSWSVPSMCRWRHSGTSLPPNAPPAVPKTSLPSHRLRLTSLAANGDIGREVDPAPHPPESASSPRDDENQPEVMFPARIRGKSSVVTAAVVALSLKVGSRDHIAST